MRVSVMLLAGLFSASTAAAQTASVSVSSDAVNDEVTPGQLVTVSVDATYTSAGMGIFGTAGLFGFGGDAVATGNGTASSPLTNASLTFGVAPGAANGAGVDRIGAGTGLSPALTGGADNLFTYTLEVPGDAADGDMITIAYSGAVILDGNDTLITFSTNPGPNQNTLTVTDLTLTVGAAGGCNAADLNADNNLDFNDINLFVSAFLGNTSDADLNMDGNYDFNDINLFVSAFLGGCP